MIPVERGTDRCKRPGRNPGGSPKAVRHSKRSASATPASPATGTPPRMKILKNPYVQGFLVVVASLVVLSFVKPYLAKVPLLNRI